MVIVIYYSLLLQVWEAMLGVVVRHGLNGLTLWSFPPFINKGHRVLLLPRLKLQLCLPMLVCFGEVEAVSVALYETACVISFEKFSAAIYTIYLCLSQSF